MRQFAAALVALLLSWGLSLPALAETPKARIAVLELRGPLAKDQLAVLADRVREGVLQAMRGTDYVVMSRENIAVLLKDMGKDCKKVQGECEVETGRNIGAAYVVSGGVVRMGNLWMCTLKVHETKGGALLGTSNVRSEVVVDLVDEVPPAVRRLMAQSIKGLVAPVKPSSKLVPNPNPKPPPPVNINVDFSTLQVDMDVQGLLKKQKCEEAAKRDGEIARDERLQATIGRTQDEAGAAWTKMLPQLQACQKLARDQRGGCIDPVEKWLSMARAMKVQLPAGVEQVKTSCGAKEMAFPAISRTVSALQVREAEALLARLKSSGSGAKDPRGFPSSWTKETLKGTTWYLRCPRCGDKTVKEWWRLEEDGSFSYSYRGIRSWTHNTGESWSLVQKGGKPTLRISWNKDFAVILVPLPSRSGQQTIGKKTSRAWSKGRVEKVVLSQVIMISRSQGMSTRSGGLTTRSGGVIITRGGSLGGGSAWTSSKLVGDVWHISCPGCGNPKNTWISLKPNGRFSYSNTSRTSGGTTESDDRWRLFTY